MRRAPLPGPPLRGAQGRGLELASLFAAGLLVDSFFLWELR